MKEHVVITPAVRAASLGGTDRAFFWIGGLIIVIGVLIFAGRKMISAAASPPPHKTTGIGATVAEAISSPWALFGGLAIFLYVGAEVAIGTQMALFLNSTYVWNVPLETAGKYVSLYCGGAMVGRLVGSAFSIDRQPRKKRRPVSFASPSSVVLRSRRSPASCRDIPAT